MEKKPHLVRWLTLCLSKEKGGLGVRCLAMLNRVLLCKRLWHYLIEFDSMWRKFVGLNFWIAVRG